MSISLQEYNKLLERVSRLESYVFPMLDSSQAVINFNPPEREIPKPKSEPQPSYVDLSKAQYIVKIAVGKEENYAIWNPETDIPEKDYYYLSLVNPEGEERIVTAKVNRTDPFVLKNSLGLGLSNLQNLRVSWNSTQGFNEVFKDTLPLSKNIGVALKKMTLNNTMPLPTSDMILKYLDGIYIRTPKIFSIFGDGGGYSIIISNGDVGIINSETKITVGEIV